MGRHQIYGIHHQGRGTADTDVITCNEKMKEWSPWLGVLEALMQFLNDLRGIFHYLGQTNKYMRKYMRNMSSVYPYSYHQTLHIPHHYFDVGT